MTEQPTSQASRPCPHCGVPIPSEARLCGHCWKKVTPIPTPPVSSARESPGPTSPIVPSVHTSVPTGQPPAPKARPFVSAVLVWVAWAEALAGVIIAVILGRDESLTSSLRTALTLGVLIVALGHWALLAGAARVVSDVSAIRRSLGGRSES
jgi:hypothetical protein